MPCESDNIYKKCRKKAGFMQESAAEELDISVESIRAYETNQRRPPDLIVLAMVEVYRDLSLGYSHLQGNPLVRLLYPLVNDISLEQVTLKLLVTIKNMEARRSIDRLIEIAEDGVIDTAERADFDEIVRVLQEIMRCGLALQMQSGES